MFEPLLLHGSEYFHLEFLRILQKYIFAYTAHFYVLLCDNTVSYY